MTISNLNKPLVNLAGGPLIDDSDSKKEITLKDVAITALMNVPQDERPTAIQKVERYHLAQTLYKSSTGIINLTPEEIVLLKDLIGKEYGPIIVGQAYEILDGKK